ncbi:hypothetical protein ACY2L5_004317 [Providencia rettgeri]
MLNWVSKIFKKQESSKIDMSEIEDIPILNENINDKLPLDINYFLLRELKRSDAVKPDCYDTAMRHLTFQQNLFKEGTQLTTDEKKALGISTRIKYITKEYIDILNLNAINLSINPKYILDEIYSIANHKFSLYSQIEKSRDVGIKNHIFHIANTGLECSWCCAMEGKKLSVNEDIVELMETNCTCERSLFILTPDIEW